MAEKKMDFSAFMADSADKIEPKDYIASNRFKGADDKPVPWKIKPISQEENEALGQECTTTYVTPTGEKKTRTDSLRYMAALIVRCVVYPNLNDAALQSSYGAVGAEELVKKMLLPGEFVDLYNAVGQLNGFETDMKEKIKTAKN